MTSSRGSAGSPAAPKRFRDGTHRTVAPEQTLARVLRLRPVLGITRVADVTGLDVVGLPVVAVHRPNARSLSVSFGKGITPEAARASGIMEALEAFHAERVQGPLMLASYNELVCQKAVVDVARLPRLSVSAFHENRRLLWIEGLDALSREPKWLPYEVVHTDFRVPLPNGSGCFFISSNGLASGNHPLEATLHGICEIVERDANTLWHAHPRSLQDERLVDLCTVDDTSCRALIDRLEAAGLLVLVWETTSNIALPAYLCGITERTPSSLLALGPVFGSGCHTAREIALSRALTEAAQGRLTFISGARDDLTRGKYRASAALDHQLDLTERARRAECRSFRDSPTFDGQSIDEDVSHALSKLRASGVQEVIVVDLSLPAIGVPVVRVVIPGLEMMHDVPGYAPGPRARRALERRACRA
ncbi:MAG: YcaO-like family protein [Polyangiaceae bacterium]|nr:YcaO-like family protein [Polyangiaceae bacterium]